MVPKHQLLGKDFLAISDFSKAEIDYFLSEALSLKELQKQGIAHQFLKGKVLAMIFEKSSTRTRVSFEVGMYQLGGYPMFLSSNDLQLGRGETIADTARVLSRYVDGIMIRTFAHEKVLELAKYATVPVINGLTDEHHPCQVLADLLTILELKGDFKNLKLCYIGDGNNMANSLLEGAVKVGMNVAIASPDGYQPDPHLVGNVHAEALVNGTEVLITNDPIEAIKDADIVYTDVWTSMGQEDEQAIRLEKFQDYQVNAKLCEHASDDFIFLHCLPAHRGEEVTDEIMDGSHSFVFQQAENRIHAQKAILKILLATG
ncbi:MAG: ornithine carbamoyltransferase [Firmicutes bacterium]|nr:ornithine carbamoyltransferase [Bacillota bacterium]